MMHNILWELIKCKIIPLDVQQAEFSKTAVYRVYIPFRKPVVWNSILLCGEGTMERVWNLDFLEIIFLLHGPLFITWHLLHFFITWQNGFIILGNAVSTSWFALQKLDCIGELSFCRFTESYELKPYVIYYLIFIGDTF